MAPESRAISFACGCFVNFWAEGNELREALACCKRHEKPYQSLSGIIAVEPLLIERGNVGRERVSRCLRCKVKLASKIESTEITSGHQGIERWYHADPRKQSYQQKDCSPSAPGHSTAPIYELDYERISYE